jgi:CDP-glucose 4,6-dehydratase
MPATVSQPAPSGLRADFWQRSTVLVTGATGLLGSHLVRALLDRHAHVIALVRDGIPQSLFHGWGLDQKAVSVRGDLTDLPLLKRLLAEYEVNTIFHLGAQTLVGTAFDDPVATFESNIKGTWNILEAARQRGPKMLRVLIASSDKAYGNLEGQSYSESTALQGRYPYDVSKSCADLLAQSYHHTYGLPVAITRCGNFFGAGDLNYSRLIPGTIRDVLAGRPPVIRSDGKFIRDYLYIEDGVGAYLQLAEALVEKNLFGNAFNFSYGLKLSALEVVQKILVALQRPDLQPTILNTARAEIPVQTLNADKARQLLQWQPHFGFDAGLRRTLDWYRSHLAA